MDVTFPVSGVETSLWVPPLVAFLISVFTSMAGVSGAFLLLPFQMSVLGFASPNVTPTNHLFNLCAVPGGAYRYARERRLLWPLTVAVLIGTVPGDAIGVVIRVTALSDPIPFKVFVGAVLLVIGARLLQDTMRALKAAAAPSEGGWEAQMTLFTWRRLAFRFRGESHECSTLGIVVLSFLVGIVGGAYGIGGGAIIAPVFVTFFRLPVHAVAGATLVGTFATSLAAVILFQTLAPLLMADVSAGPDWPLGALFGVGGLMGTYVGARMQRFVPAAWLKLMLGLIALYVAGRYALAILEG